MDSLQNFTIVEGEVIDNNDEAQMGRLKIYIPHIDNPSSRDNKELPWARYASPFGGVSNNLASGPNHDVSYGPSSYGFWAIPKVGAKVLAFFLNGDPNVRIYFASMFPISGNRSLPGGRNQDSGTNGPWTDSYEKMNPMFENITAAGLNNGDHYLTRAYERQVAQAADTKDGTEGYASRSNEPGSSKLDPQTYCFTTPGHHFLSMQDSPEFCRIRLRTQAGSQIILDDTNERIYISTAKGNTYLELDQDGHVHLYGSESISMHTNADFNIKADKKINIEAGEEIHMKAGKDIFIDGKDINVDAKGSVFNTAGKDINLYSDKNILNTGLKSIHFNSAGNKASKANTASSGEIQPDHEPWDRPSTKGSRNKYWKK